jgi:hypothetical protein
LGFWGKNDDALPEGCGEHCLADNSSMAVDYMADWVAEMLGGDPKGVKSGPQV